MREESMRDYVLFYLNGVQHQVSGEDVFQPLSDYVRYNQGLIGTKVVCAEGDCGACTVLLGKRNGNRLDYQVVNSCIQYVFQLDCTHVVTVEGLKHRNQLHPVQQAMIDHFGSQCGYCTPGFVVALAGLLENQKSLSEPQVKDALTGNLCRCTGYRSIINAAMSIRPRTVRPLAEWFPETELLYQFEQNAKTSISIETSGTQRRFFNPITSSEAIALKALNPEATVISGGTDLAVQMNKDRIAPMTIISLSNVSDLQEIKKLDGFFYVGAKATWTDLQAAVGPEIPQLQKIIEVFASPQIKNVGTLAGNIANASPIADSVPFLYVMEACVELTGKNGSRWVSIDDFYKGYKVTAMESDELITQVRIPVLRDQQNLRLYKISKRKDLDISTFTAAFLVEVKDGVIQDIRMAVGGVGPVVLRLTETENHLKGKAWEKKIFQGAATLALGEVVPLSDVRASQKYRWLLAKNTILKFFHEITAELEGS